MSKLLARRMRVNNVRWGFLLIAIVSSWQREKKTAKARASLIKGGFAGAQWWTTRTRLHSRWLKARHNSDGYSIMEMNTHWYTFVIIVVVGEVYGDNSSCINGARVDDDRVSCITCTYVHASIERGRFKMCLQEVWNDHESIHTKYRLVIQSERQLIEFC